MSGTSAASADERVRLFVALELPEPARAELIRWRGRVLRGVDGLRYITEPNLHATLCFLGSRRSAEVGAIADACAVLAVQPAASLSLGEAIWLPERRPHVLAVTLQDTAGALAGAQATLSEVLAAGGWYEPEQRPYLGHVTVARAGRGTRVPRRPLSAPEALQFQARRVTLYRSRLSRAGARYEPLTTIELGGGG